ncbi:GNAT family N-acetyltransferase [Blastococcus colisei]|uniref:GNAT family N-acetyltransferase n=1 Tax=Blastococcus colisei TaxID=1564162 RepID=UPI001B88683B|nr:GNAT family N-acetyltransferase [Blastococcus colisei]
MLVGSALLHSIDRLQDDAQIGYWTAPAGRGRGVATEAVRRWAYGALPVDRIEFCHAVENAASPAGLRRRPASPSRARCGGPTATATA